MIPKIIHYCWFGGKELPGKVKKCMDTWKLQMPDWEMLRIDETNLLFLCPKRLFEK